jgi:tetratricopeptide (TPR) repeat protein
MIDDCPELTVLATSREPLGVTGEAVWALPPLGIDDAVALFRNRTPGSAENDPELSIAACERLGRMPLAIELAAARMRSIALPDLVARLDDQLGLLISGARDSPRHQTLRATLEWSHDLLTPEERSVFRRMAVFAGGGSLAAIEVVAAEGGADVVRALDGLVNKSLVLLSPSGGRYHLLEPIRQFAVDQLLASGELELAQRAHAAWACGFAREANRGLFADQRHWTAMLAAERDNLGAAIGWMLSHGQAEAAAGLISNLAWYWFTAGRADSFVWVALVLDRLGELPPPARAKALLAAGISHCDHFDDRRPLAWLDEAATIFRRIGNRRSLGAALFWLGRATAGRLDFQRAEAIFVESLAVHEEVGDLFGVGWSLTWTGCLARLRGDLDQDEAIQHSVLERCEAIPHVVGQAFAELSFVANERGDWVAADELIGRAVEVYRDLGDRWQLGLMTGTRASHLIEADPERAVAYNIESLTLLREMDADPNVVYGLETAAALLLEAGRTREAATVLGSIKGDVAGRDIDGWDRHRQTVLAKLSALIDDPTWAVEIDRGRRGGVRGATEAAIHWLADGPPRR